jgi:hypothetical protein
VREIITKDEQVIFWKVVALAARYQFEVHDKVYAKYQKKDSW